MAKHGQIPRFGNWDKDDIPYSVYFDNARKERSGARINPNNPEENRDVFGEKEAVEDGSNSDLDRCSDEDSIQICATPTEKSSFLWKQQNGNSGSAYALTGIQSDRPSLETPPGAPSASRDESAFNKTGSVKNFYRSETTSSRFSGRGAQTHHHQRRLSIPKVGSSTDNNIPYMSHIKNAREDKAGSKMNPSNPDKTHDAFRFQRGSPGNDCDISLDTPSRLISPDSSHWSSLSVHQINDEINAGYYKESSTRRRTPVRSRASEKETNRMNPQHPLCHDGHHKITSDKRNSTLRTSSTNSSSCRRNKESSRRPNGNQPYDSPCPSSPSTPAFARWDDTSEGYSDTDNKAKEQKETKSVDSCPAPILPVAPAKNPSNQNSRKQGGWLKASCCLFPEEKE